MRPAGLQITVRLSRVGKRVTRTHGDSDPAVSDCVKEFGYAPGELVISAIEIPAYGAGQVHRTRTTQPLRVDRRDRATGRTEKTERAADGQARQAGVECGATDPVVYRRGAASVREFADE